MPMIDIHVPAGRVADPKALATRAAAAMREIEGVPDIPMFRRNTACYVHEVPPGRASDIDGDEDLMRVQVLTGAGGLSREKQIAVVSTLSTLVAEAVGDDAYASASGCC